MGEKDKRVENQLQAATAILCECLEYLPLGIELVGAYLVRDPEISLDIMFGRLQERKLANLLQQVEERAGCYKIHALVRWFLQEELANSGKTKSVLEKTFVTAMITKAQNLPDSPTSEHIEGIRDVVPHIEDLGKRLIVEIGEAYFGSWQLLAILDLSRSLIFKSEGRSRKGRSNKFKL
ncbi:MAG: hypothetical protein V7K53_10480 [Nostoc sp.]|uniref:hypothetical protein n=1 Tax=Nostoc sp. TaxID=1180 RepID=UPI002FF69B29